jgi:hypothetical protein
MASAPPDIPKECGGFTGASNAGGAYTAAQDLRSRRPPPRQSPIFYTTPGLVLLRP